MSAATDTVLATEQTALDSRPRIVGVPGKTYLRAGIDETSQFPANRLYLNGEDITNFCFEFDLEGRWAGMFKHHYEGGKIVLDEPDEWSRSAIDDLRYWQFGKIEIRPA